MNLEYFELVSKITDIETIAVGPKIHELAELVEDYGPGRWRKLKGRALARLEDGFVYLVEVHWYEAHGIGRRRSKVKRVLEEHR